MIYIIISLSLIIVAIIFNKKKNISEFFKSESTHMIDGWSIYHFNSGVIYQIIVKRLKFNNKLLYGFLLAVLFEIFENSKIGKELCSKAGTKFLSNRFKSYQGDNLSNALMDIVFFMLGYCVSFNINNTLISICIILINEFLVYFLHKWHFSIDLKNYFTNNS
jgi:hypothetical protein